MWIWLSISMLLVIASMVFGIYSFIRSRSLQRSFSPARETGYNGSTFYSGCWNNNIAAAKSSILLYVNSKIKSSNHPKFLSSQSINELKKRMKMLESAATVLHANEDTNLDDSGEDWEKLYYKVRKDKQSLENNLNVIKTSLRINLTKLEELEKQHAGSAATKSDLELRINEVSSLHNTIEELQRKIDGGKERERELAQESAREKSSYYGYELVQNDNARLQSEIDILTKRIEDVNRENIALEEQIKNLAKLRSILEISK